MEESSGRPDRVIRFLDQALLDLADVDNTTATIWGESQADLYISRLVEAIQAIADSPTLGKIIEELPQYRSFLFKSNQSRWANGHRIVYCFTESEVEIVRILHTGVDVIDHLDG